VLQVLRISAESEESKLPSPLELNAEAHFLALWGTLLEAGISEAKIYDVLAEEALQKSFQSLAKQLGQELGNSLQLNAFFKDEVRRAILRPWILALLFKFERAGELEDLAKALIKAGKILADESRGWRRSLFWRKVGALNSQGVDADEILEALARDAKNAGDLNFSETLYVAARTAANGKSLPVALAKSAKSFRRSEKIILAAAIGSEDLTAVFKRLSELAQYWPSQNPETAPRNSPVRTIKRDDSGKTAKNFKKTISQTLSSVSDLLGLKTDSKDDQSSAIKDRNDAAGEAVRQAVEAARQQRRAQRIKQAEKPHALSKTPLIRVKGRRKADDPGRSAANKDPNDSSSQLPSIQKTIGPAWLTPAESVEADSQIFKKTIGPGDQDSADDPRENPGDPQISVVSRTAPGDHEGQQRAYTNITVDRLRAYLLLLEESPEHIIIADQIEQGIARLREAVGKSYDSDDEELRRELDDIELAFGAWKAQNGR
jgi:hypothetical protein